MRPHKKPKDVIETLIHDAVMERWRGSVEVSRSVSITSATKVQVTE